MSFKNQENLFGDSNVVEEKYLPITTNFLSENVMACVIIFEIQKLFWTRLIKFLKSIFFFANLEEILKEANLK